MSLWFLSVNEIFSFNGLFQTSFGAKQAGMGGANLAVGGSVMDLESNPSHLGDLKSKKFEAGSAFHFANLRYEDKLNSPNPDFSFSNRIESHPIAPLPYIGYISPITGNIGLGIAFYTQAGGGGVFRDILKNSLNGQTLNETLGTNDPILGRQKQIHQSLTFKFITNKITPAIGVNFGKLSIGGGIDFIVSRMMFQRIFTDTTDTIELPGTFRYQSNISYSLGGKFGTTYKLTPDTKIAYAYISGHVSHLDGRMEVYTSDRNFPVQYTDISKLMSLPPRHIIGISHKTGDFLFAFDIRYIQWSQGFGANKFILERPLIPTPLGVDTNIIQFNINWKDQTVFALGMEYEFKKSYFFRLGYNYGKTPLSPYGINPMIGTTTEHHLSTGLGLGSETFRFNFALEYAFPKKMTGAKSSDWAIANSVYSKDNVQAPGYSHSKTVSVFSLFLGVEVFL
ncbi:MAG: outer membrane protein transport protein [Leptospiraceae bacterium]|nr:outer membrane protein transport protein [Leptospiraceae bacterium]